MELGLVKNFANENAIDSDASLSAVVHDAGVSVTLLEEQVLVVKIYELVFDRLHSLLQPLEDQMVPVRRKSQKLPEVRHVKFKNHHHDAGLQHAVFASEFQKTVRFLDQNALLLEGRRFVRQVLLVLVRFDLLFATFAFHGRLLAAGRQVRTLFLTCCGDICVFDFVEQLIVFRIRGLALAEHWP